MEEGKCYFKNEKLRKIWGDRPLIIKENNLTIRYLQEQDKHLLVKWLSNPSVLKYYEGRDKPFNLEKVTRKFYNQDDGVNRYIVEYNVSAIGYIQFYRANNKIDVYIEREIIYGMDQFIGETEYWNKGIGTLMVRSMVKYLVGKKQGDRVIMDPQVTNKRALTCYEKCGFKKIRILPEHEFHEGTFRDCWLMEYRKA